jgi:hypothetical protein
MGIGWKIQKFYEEHPMTIEEWEKENNMSHDNPHIDWDFSFDEKNVDLCISMCCYAKINRTENGDYCTCCGSRMAGS